MLNYFFVYPFIWLTILFLYILDFSTFNIKLNGFLVLFLIATSLISLVLGVVFRKKFEFKKTESHMTLKPLFVLIIGAIIEFIYIKDVPFISIAILKTQEYRFLEFAPILHVVIAAFGMYYSTRYCYNAICNAKERKKSIFAILMILLLFLLYFARSFMIMILFSTINMFFAFLISEKKLKIKHIVISFVAIIVLLFGYGAMGNIRQGYKWQDSSYIETIGLYDKYPSFIPKQFMWPYSYLTTPLANLNYNVINNNSNFEPLLILGEIVPQTISKRVPIISSDKSCELIRPYFNVSTGFCSSYVKGGFLGMIVLFAFLMILGILGVKCSNDEKVSKDYIVFCSILTLVTLFMFFDNMLSYVGLSIPFWISFIILLVNNNQEKLLELKRYILQKLINIKNRFIRLIKKIKK